jgi:DNA-binding response OmpR family regulator
VGSHTAVRRKGHPLSEHPLLIVEDDPASGSNLERALTNAGYQCARAESVAQASAMRSAPSLVLLDLGLPDGDGLDLAKDFLDRWPGLPIIILTARADEMDVVVGLDAGAVDYVTKPFRLAELLARVRAHLRGGLDHAPAVYEDGNLRVDTGARRVTLDGGELVLRAKEFDLLVELLSHSGNVVTREDLMSRVWDEHWFGSTKTLDVHIAALRRRLGEQAGAPSRITALRGVGYRWEPMDGPGTA